MKLIRIYLSKWSKDGVDTNYKFIQWVADGDTVIAVVEDLVTGQIREFKLSQYVMAFVKKSKKNGKN